MKTWSATLPYPPSANQYWRSLVIGRCARVVLSREAKAYRQLVKSMAITNRPGPLAPAFPEGDVLLRLCIYRPIRRGDLSNRIKVLEDALQGIAFTDDAQVKRLEADLFDDKADPRVEVEVEPLNQLELARG